MALVIKGSLLFHNLKKKKNEKDNNTINDYVFLCLNEFARNSRLS